MTFADNALDRLAPATPWEPDWSDVLARAGDRRLLSRRLLTKRRLLIALAVLAAFAVPLAALAAAKDWWFFRFGDFPRPVRAPVVVKEGVWSGHPWELIAYPSTTDGLCLAVAPKGAQARGDGAAMSCAPQIGVARTPETKASPDMTITFLTSSAGDRLPGYIVGPVVEDAATVVIRLDAGTALRVPTFGGPSSVGHVRFYASELPANGGLPPGLFGRRFRLTGLDRGTAVDGVSPLSACR